MILLLDIHVDHSRLLSTAFESGCLGVQRFLMP